MFGFGNILLKFAGPPALPLIFACDFSFPVGLKISSLVNYALKFLDRIFIWYLRN
jgi:hypothetical protein